MSKKINFVVKLQRPVCRTPIKPVQKHKNVAKFARKSKHPAKMSCFLLQEQ
jgi:hypothetical protein